MPARDRGAGCANASDKGPRARASRRSHSQARKRLQISGLRRPPDRPVVRKGRSRRKQPRNLRHRQFRDRKTASRVPQWTPNAPTASPLWDQGLVEADRLRGGPSAVRSGNPPSTAHYLPGPVATTTGFTYVYPYHLEMGARTVAFESSSRTESSSLTWDVNASASEPCRRRGSRACSSLRRASSYKPGPRRLVFVDSARGRFPGPARGARPTELSGINEDLEVLPGGRYGCDGQWVCF